MPPGPAGQVTVAGWVGPGGAALAQNRVGEGGDAGPGTCHGPHMADPGAIHVVHPAGVHFSDEHVRGLILTGLTQFGPLRRPPVNGRRRGVGRPGLRPRSKRLFCQGPPAADPGERPQHQQRDERIQAVGDPLRGEHPVIAGDQNDQGEQRILNGQGVPAEAEGVREDEGQRDQRTEGGDEGTNGLLALGDDVPDDVGPAAQARHGVDEDREEHTVGNRLGLGTLVALR